MTIKWDENGKREIEEHPSLTGSDATMMKALAHPVRARALTVLNERIASPSELAAEQEEQRFYHEREIPDWRAALAPLETDEHQEFLEFLHIPADEIKTIRAWSAGGAR